MEVEGKPDAEPPEDTRPDVREAMGIPSAPSMGSGSGGAGRMPTISEDQPSIPAPPPTVEGPATTRSETDSIMETQPQLEPSAVASVRSPRSMESTPDRNVRQRTEETEFGNSATGVAPTPLGGWQASEAYGPTRNTGNRQNRYLFPHVTPMNITQN